MDPALEKLRTALIEIARRRDFSHYQPIADLFGLDMASPADRREIGRLLGEVSRFEVGQGRPMLSSVVVVKGVNVPGEGFFTLGQELRLVETGEDEIAFGVRQMRLTHDYWASAPSSA